MSPGRSGAAVGLLLVVAGCCARSVSVVANAGATRARLRREEDTGPPGWFGSLLDRLELPVDPERAWPVILVGAGATALLAAAVVPIAAIAILGGGAVAVAATPGMRRRREARSYDLHLARSVDDLVAALASGASLSQSVAAAGRRATPSGRDLAEVAARHALGVGLQAELDAWAGRRPGSGAGLVADAVALAGMSGGSGARALEGVARTLGERQALRREVRALGSQARASAAVLVVVPVAFAAFLAATDPRIGRFTLATPSGWACIAGGVALDGAGAWWMARLVRRVG